MKTASPLVFLLLLPGLLAAQDSPPPHLAPVEIERSRWCVEGLALLDSVDARLEPLSRRADRLEAISRAIVLEDRDRVAPFDAEDPVEAAVEAWFGVDDQLAARYQEAQDEAILEERQTQKEAIRERVLEAFVEVSREAEALVTGTEGVPEAIARCDDVVLLRGPVLEECGDAPTAVCEAARATEPVGGLRFVDSVEQLWDIERIRPWSESTRLHPGADGLLAGGVTTTTLRRGNVKLTLAVEALLQERSALPPEELGALEANLDSLGFEFGHPDLVMFPALGLRFGVTQPLAGEDAYLLHFGDLSEPEEQVIHSIPAAESGPVEAIAPLGRWALDRIVAGEPMWLTAVRADEDDPMELEALYSLGIDSLRQAESVGALLEYWSGGEYAEDLLALIPPSEPGG